MVTSESGKASWDLYATLPSPHAGETVHFQTRFHLLPGGIGILKGHFSMITLTQRLLCAGLLATAALAASAQTPPTPAAPAAPAAAGAPAAEARRMHPHPRDGKFAERMQQRRAQHLADLKAKLKLTASQEGAWSTFTTASQPPARPAQDRQAARAEFEKLTTPQRIERMQARQAERSAMFARRADATKTFYAALTPEQQKTFDAETLRHGHRGGHGGHRPGSAPAPVKG